MKRRNFVGVTCGAAFGLNLPDVLRAQYNNNNATAKSVIHIYLPGGMSHQESFDPKPHAPSEYRGPYTPIKTNVEGILMGPHFKETAKVADKLAIINSMTHGEAAHERGTHNMFTGYRPSPAISYPSFGSVISHELGSRNSLPPYVAVPNTPNEFAGTGHLSSQYSPFGLGSDPASPTFKVRDLDIPVDQARFERRRGLLEMVNSKFEKEQKSDNIDAIGKFYDQAYSLIGNKAAKDAFNINLEESKTREAYGKGSAGSRFLIARRLVEAGTRMVTVTFGSWDMHDNIKIGYDNQAPEFDKAFAALITDLSDRGLLDETLIMVSSEFGRTPKINKTSGRDHWPRVFSTVLAGGGVNGGLIYGSSDTIAAEVDTDPVTPADLATTMYHCMGINARQELMAPGPRPIEIVDGGNVISKLL
jgi:uncharacterized protein (DUF1501 family)|tara:strand:- start:11879 stop:13132 length:1254 start_codon:yes stop_codon:yes gene_type:complete